MFHLASYCLLNTQDAFKPWLPLGRLLFSTLEHAFSTLAPHRQWRFHPLPFPRKRCSFALDRLLFQPQPRFFNPRPSSSMALCPVFPTCVKGLFFPPSMTFSTLSRCLANRVCTLPGPFLTLDLAFKLHFLPVVFPTPSHAIPTLFSHVFQPFHVSDLVCHPACVFLTLSYVLLVYSGAHCFFDLPSCFFDLHSFFLTP